MHGGKRYEKVIYKIFAKSDNLLLIKNHKIERKLLQIVLFHADSSRFKNLWKSSCVFNKAL